MGAAFSKGAWPVGSRSPTASLSEVESEDEVKGLIGAVVVTLRDHCVPTSWVDAPKRSQREVPSLCESERSWRVVQRLKGPLPDGVRMMPSKSSRKQETRK